MDFDRDITPQEQRQATEIKEMLQKLDERQKFAVFGFLSGLTTAAAHKPQAAAT